MKTITLVAIIAAIVVVGGACVGIPLSGVLNDMSGTQGNNPVQPTDPPVEPTPTETPTPTPTSTPMSSFSGGGPKSDSGSSSVVPPTQTETPTPSTITIVVDVDDARTIDLPPSAVSGSTDSSLTLPDGYAGKVTFSQVSGITFPTGVDPYMTVDIELNPPLSSGQYATINFEVPLAEITANGITPTDVYLYHYGETGVDRITPTIVSSGEVVVYAAEVTEFSPFAVVFVTPTETEETPCTHTWGSYQSNNDGTHYRVCELCQEKEEGNCDYNGVFHPATEEGKHYQKCVICEYETTPVTCDFSDTLTPDTTGTTHSYKCSFCNRPTGTADCDEDSITQKGQIEGVYSHERACSKCSQTPVIEACNKGYTHIDDTEKHSISCTVCSQPLGEETCPGDYTYDSEKNALTKTCENCEEPYEIFVYASIAGETTSYYKSLAAAIEAAGEGQEITLLRNIDTETTISKKVIINPNNKNVHLTYTNALTEDDINTYVKIKKTLGAESTVNVTTTDDGQMAVNIEEKFGEDDCYIFDYSMNTAGDRMHIYTADGMRTFAGMVKPGETFSGKTVRLMADVNLGGKDNPWTAIGNVNSYPSYTFAGEFDGKGNTISDMYVTASGDGGVASAGLFGSITGKVKNVVIDNAVVTSSHYAGGIVGFSSANVGMEISGCTVKNSVITSAPEQTNPDTDTWDNGDKVGGIIGYMVSGDVVTGNTVEKTTIKAYRDLGGIAGHSRGTVTANTVNDVTLIVDILHNYNGYTDISAHDCNSIVGDGTISSTDNNKEENVEKFVGIYTAEDMFAFGERVNNNGYKFSGWTVKLLENIDLNNQVWIPIGQTGETQFLGTFDGNGKTISNLNIDSSAQTGGTYSSGLFGWIERHGSDPNYLMAVKNLNVNGATVTGHHNVAVISGYLIGTIENCHVTKAVVTCTHANDAACGDKAGVIAGIAAEANAVIKDCTAKDSTVTAGRDAGQIVGACIVGKLEGTCSADNVTVTATGDCNSNNIRNELIGRIS